MPCLRCAHVGPVPIAGTVISPRRSDECAPGALLGASTNTGWHFPSCRNGKWGMREGSLLVVCLNYRARGAGGEKGGAKLGGSFAWSEKGNYMRADGR